MLRKALTTIEFVADVTIESLDTTAFALEVAEYIGDIAPYWTPSQETLTESGVEFMWPNGSMVAIERSLGKWFLETDEELIPLSAGGPQQLATEIDRILREKGYDAWLGETEIRFDNVTPGDWPS